MTEQDARKHVEDLKGFYTSLASYLVVMTMLAGINLLTNPDYLWFVWALLGWGVGILAHAVKVFGLPGMGGWEERKIRALTGQDETQAGLDALRVQLRRIEHGERANERAESSDTARLQRRIENLEAIVTSRDWDLLDADYRPATPALDPETLPEPEEQDADHAERLARRVR